MPFGMELTCCSYYTGLLCICCNHLVHRGSLEHRCPWKIKRIRESWFASCRLSGWKAVSRSCGAYQRPYPWPELNQCLPYPSKTNRGSGRRDNHFVPQTVQMGFAMSHIQGIPLARHFPISWLFIYLHHWVQLISFYLRMIGRSCRFRHCTSASAFRLPWWLPSKR